MTRPLFLVGNKRSGTSQLVRLLNLHPKIFVAHESDVCGSCTSSTTGCLSRPIPGILPGE